MNKKIAGELAVGIIIVLTILIGGIFWMNGNENEKEVEVSVDKKVMVKQENNKEPELPNKQSANNQAWINSNIYNNEQTSVDRETFQIINDQIAKDKNKIYIANYVDGYSDFKFDPASFEALIEVNNSGGYIKDKDKVAIVYMSGGANAIHELKDADPKTFQSLNNTFGKDIENVYSLEKVISNADAATFQALNGNYGKDINSVYFGDKKIEKADPQTFKIIDSQTAADKSNSYQCTYANVVCGTNCMLTDLQSGKKYYDYFGNNPIESVCYAQ